MPDLSQEAFSLIAVVKECELDEIITYCQSSPVALSEQLFELLLTNDDKNDGLLATQDKYKNVLQYMITQQLSKESDQDRQYISYLLRHAKGDTFNIVWSYFIDDAVSNDLALTAAKLLLADYRNYEAYNSEKWRYVDVAKLLRILGNGGLHDAFSAICGLFISLIAYYINTYNQNLMSRANVLAVINLFNVKMREQDEAQVQSKLGYFLKLAIVCDCGEVVLTKLLGYVRVSERGIAHPAVCEAACEAAKRGKLHALRLFYQNNIKLYWYQRQSDCYSTPAHEAVRYGQAKVSEWLSRHSSFFVLIEDKQNHNLYHCLKTLLRNGEVSTTKKVRIAKLINDTTLDNAYSKAEQKFESILSYCSHLYHKVLSLNKQKQTLQAAIRDLKSESISSNNEQSEYFLSDLSLMSPDLDEQGWFDKPDMGVKIRLLYEHSDKLSSQKKELQQISRALSKEIKKLTQEKERLILQALLDLRKEKQTREYELAILIESLALMTTRVRGLEATVASLSQPILPPFAELCHSIVLFRPDMPSTGLSSRRDNAKRLQPENEDVVPPSDERSDQFRRLY